MEALIGLLGSSVGGALMGFIQMLISKGEKAKDRARPQSNHLVQECKPLEKFIMKYIILLITLFIVGCGKPEIRPADEKVYTKLQMKERILDIRDEYKGANYLKIDRAYDGKYCLPNHEDMVEVLNYIAFEIIPQLNFDDQGYLVNARDCDKFAFKVAADIPFYTVSDFPKAAIPIGIISLYMPTPHAIVGWIDDKGVWFAEPQATRKAKIWHISELEEAKTIYRINPL